MAEPLSSPLAGVDETMTTPFLFSASSTYSWHKCRRDFFNRFLLNGQGVTGVYVEEDLIFGSLVHEIVPKLWVDSAIDFSSTCEDLEQRLLNDPIWEADLTPEGRVMKAQEWGRLLAGILHAFRRGLLPFLAERYRLESAESDLARWLPEYQPDQVALIAKPDALLIPNPDFQEDEWLGPGWPLAGLGYLEYKTVAAPTPRWQAAFQRNPQSWTGAMTVKAARNVDLEWFMVCGLVKGTETKTEEPLGRRRVSPLCWAYRCLPGEGSGRASQTEATAITAPDGSKWHWEHTNAKGWKRVATDLFPGGVKGWVEALPLEVVQQQVVMTAPITIDWDLAEEWLRNQEEMIGAVQAWRDILLSGADQPATRNALFPRELSECESHRGPCSFLKLCHNAAVAEDPIGSGYYQPRRAHHPLEVELCGGDHGEK